MKCPHCTAELLAHEGSKLGFHHCEECGCCFTDALELRPGHPACAGAPVIEQAAPSPEAMPEPAPPELDDEHHTGTTNDPEKVDAMMRGRGRRQRVREQPDPDFSERPPKE